MIIPTYAGGLVAESTILVEYTPSAEGVYFEEVTCLVEYTGNATTYIADIPSIAECIALVEYTFGNLGFDFTEVTALVEYSEVPGGIWVGEVTYLLEYIGDDITYIPDLFSDAELTYLVEFISYVQKRPIVIQTIYGPILWIM